MEAFELIATHQVSRHEAQDIVHRCFADLIEETEQRGGFIPRSCAPDQERDEQRMLSEEAEQDLRSQIGAVNFRGQVLTEAEAMLKGTGRRLESVAPAIRVDLLTGIARALIQREHLYRLRIEDRLAIFQSDDAFFQARTAPEVPTLASATAVSGPSVRAAVERYLAHGKRQWVKKTFEARVWQLGFFVEHVGSETPLNSVTSGNVRAFRDAVQALHKAHGKMRGASFSAKQTENMAHRIGDKTAENTFDPVRSFFRWAKSVDGLIPTNPAEDIKIVAAKTAKGAKNRRPFKKDELQLLFSAPIFTGCKSRYRRYQSGKEAIKDAKFWLPILALYTGARLGELVQLHVGDAHLGPVPHLSINEENGPDITPEDRKHVKSHAGVRLVPLHPDVMALGWTEFLAGRAKQKGKSRVRLFNEFAYGSDGQASTVASKWFARFMDSVGLKDPALVFHSFRHNAEDAFRDALTPQYVTDRIVGHSDGSTSAGYGNGPALEVLYDAVTAMKLPISVLDVLNA